MCFIPLFVPTCAVPVSSWRYFDVYTRRGFFLFSSLISFLIIDYLPLSLRLTRASRSSGDSTEKKQDSDVDFSTVDIKLDAIDLETNPGGVDTHERIPSRQPMAMGSVRLHVCAGYRKPCLSIYYGRVPSTSFRPTPLNTSTTRTWRTMLDK